MIRLEKAKQVERIKDENERKRLINEIRASRPVLNLIDQIIKEKVTNLDSIMENLIGEPYHLAAVVKTRSELRKLTQLFEETHNDNTKR